MFTTVGDRTGYETHVRASWRYEPNGFFAQHHMVHAKAMSTLLDEVEGWTQTHAHLSKYEFKVVAFHG